MLLKGSGYVTIKSAAVEYQYSIYSSKSLLGSILVQPHSGCTKQRYVRENSVSQANPVNTGADPGGVDPDRE